MFYKIKPESAAQLGAFTEYIKDCTPWKIKKLHVIFDIWLGGDLFRTPPSYYVTQRLFEKIEISKLSGLDNLSEVKVDISETFINLYPNRKPPKCYLLTISGKAGIDDIGLTKTNKLVVSDNFFKILEEIDLSNSQIEEYKIEIDSQNK